MSVNNEQRNFPNGSRLGPYEIAASIGAGGMGEVFRARDTRLNRDVAVKVLPKDFVADADRLRRFEQEAKMLAVLNHPNVLTIHDAGVHEGAPYLVSELLEGKTLREEMDGGALPVRKATEYALQIAHGLAAAHGKRVVHRDLKPENIFVTEDDRVKILDFGLAKLRPNPKSADAATMRRAAAADIDITEPGMVLGTPAYMSPEQVRGEAADHRADIFAFGCVLYEMLSRTRAFRRSTPVESMNAVLNDAPLELRTTNPNIPLALVRIVERCLEKQPDSRFQSAKDLAFAIEAVHDKGHPTLDGSQRDTSMNSRQRQVVFVIAILALCAVGAGWWLTRPRGATPASPSTGRRITSLAVLPFVNLSRDADQEYFVDGVTELLCTDLAGVSALRKVPSRTTIMQFKRTTRKIPEIAAELGVNAIVTGSVQIEGDLVVISVQLIEGATDHQLWATNYERQVSSLLRLKTELARSITAEINVQLTPQEQTRLARVRPRSPEALTNYFRGRELLNRQTFADLTNSLGCFQRALQIEPDFSEAVAGTANAYASLSSVFVAPRDAMPPARTNALVALRLDETSAEAHFVLGFILLTFDYDFVGAEKEFDRALAINPNYADAYDGRALLRQCEGRMTEAIAADETAFQLDPLSMRIGANYVSCYTLAGELDRAIRVGKEIRRLHQEKLKRDNHLAASWLGFSYSLSGDPNAAISILEPICSPKEQERLAMAMAALGHAFALAGQKDSARRTLTALEQIANERYVCVYEIAVVYAALGEPDRAFEWLYKALAARADCIPFTKFDPRLKSLHPDPRFRQLLKDIGLDK